jgi:hypothetical protein
VPDYFIDAWFLQDDISTDWFQVRVMHLVAEGLLIINLFPYSTLRQLKRAKSLYGEADVILKSREGIVEDRVGRPDV